MPGFDGTGPLGMGPRTGGGFGWCPPAAGPVPPRVGGGVLYGIGRGGRPWGGGRGRGFGGGRGFRARSRWLAPGQPLAPPEEPDVLQRQAEFLQGQLDAIRKRLDELGAGATRD
ncbi:MAG TPA: DUF5320 domain-containing protein [Planctomycetota bacterium]|nr:DUF5320 domain-containing protein [Planctomycetota bacterium]